GEGYHAVPPPYTGTFMPPKPDLVFHDAPNVSDSEDDSKAELLQNAPSFVQPAEQVKTPRPPVKPVKNSIPASNHKTAIPKPKTHGNSRNRKACFVLLTRSKLVLLSAVRQVTTAASPNNVIRPRPAKIVGTKPHSPPRRTINHRPSLPASNFPPKDTTVKAPTVNNVKGVQGNWVWKPKCPILDHVSRHTSASVTLKRFDYNDALRRSNSMFDCNEMFSSETDESLPASPIYDRYQSGEGYHAVPPPYIGIFMPPKPDLVFHDAPNINETVHTAFNVSDSEDDSKAELPQNAPSFVQPTEQVKTPRPPVKPVKNSIPASNHKTAI
nr:hypothetical protein [Tanacetum cinerariifolium]